MQAFAALLLLSIATLAASSDSIPYSSLSPLEQQKLLCSPLEMSIPAYMACTEGFHAANAIRGLPAERTCYDECQGSSLCIHPCHVCRMVVPGSADSRFCDPGFYDRISWGE